MRTFKFTFETTAAGKTSGVTIEGPSFSLAMEQASDRLRCSVSDLEHIKTQRLEGDVWITLFNPFRGKF